MNLHKELIKIMNENQNDFKDLENYISLDEESEKIIFGLVKFYKRQQKQQVKKIKQKIKYYNSILNSTIITDRYALEVNNIIRILKELLDVDTYYPLLHII